MSIENIMPGGKDQIPAVRPTTLMDAMKDFPCNQTIADNFVRAWAIINRSYENVVATISGGADSDVVVDILSKADRDGKVEYVWVNTGLEYQATKDHLDYLEERYGITITKTRPQKPIPLAIKQYGQPFLNKIASEHLMRLQHHGFKWTDGTFEELYRQYPKCKSALEWWCNMHDSDSLNIRNNKLLKEFIISNPPKFRISNKCCYYAKKKVFHEIIEKKSVDLSITGVRKAEGGARARAYKSCFGTKDNNGEEYDEYRPIWWYKNKDKEEYCKTFSIKHSRCYTEYGLPRTGCAGCPFGKDFEYELDVIRKYESKLYTAVTTLFKDSYAYTRTYREFVKAQTNAQKTKDTEEYRQLTLFEIFPELTKVS